MLAARFLPALILVLPFLAASADDIKTTTGKVYKNVTVSRVEPDGIVVTATYGIIKVPFEELPEDLRQKYNFQPKAAAAFRAELQNADAEREKQFEAARQKRIQEQQALAKANAAKIQAEPTAQSVPNPTPQRTQVNPLDAPTSDRTGTGEKCFIQGYVIQVMTGHGLLISTVKADAFGLPQPKDRSLVFVAGSFDPTLDLDDSVALNGIDAGMYTYTTVRGDEKTVKAFRFIEPRAVTPPLDPFKRR